MQRINTVNKVANLFGAGKDGYGPGNPATGQSATAMSPDALNALQEEIAGVVEGAGIALNPASNAQLLAAILWLINPANNAQLTSAISAMIINRNISGMLRSITPVGGALVREYAEIINAATVGGIEIGMAYNCAVDPVTGVWAGRDVADICWLEKWSDAGGLQQIWYAPTAAAGAVPVWQLVDSLDLVNALRTLNGSLSVSGNVSTAAATAVAHALNLGAFTGNLIAGGWVKIPVWTGAAKEFLILQWGYQTTNGSVVSGIPFPVAFPTACFGIFSSNAQNNTNWANTFNPSTTTFGAQGTAGGALYWFALGK